MTFIYIYICYINLVTINNNINYINNIYIVDI